MYEKPMAYEERFLSDNYCTSACYDYHAELYCAIPGESMSQINDGTNTKQEYGNTGVWHGGPCTTNNSCDVSGNTGMENATGHKITNVVLGSATTVDAKDLSRNIGSMPSTLTDGYYKATWENYDDDKNHYKHYGIAKISSVIQIPGRPNHS